MATAKTTRRPAKKDVASVAEWVMGTVRTGDLYAGRYPDPELKAYILRAREWVMIDASINAQSCAMWPLRLFRATKAKKQTKHLGESQRIGRKLHRTLTDNRRGKSAIYAERAGDIEEVLDGPIVELMHKPSPWYRGHDFFRLGFLYRELCGNEFLEVIAENSSEPTALLPMAPQFCRVLPDKTNFIRGYWYGRSDTDGQTLGVDDVLHRKFQQSPFDPYKGIGPLQAVLAQADLHAASTASEQAMWENDCTPGLAVRLPEGCTPDQVKQFKSQMQNDHRGVNKRGRVLVTTAAEVVKLSFSPKEMEYLAGRNNCADIIHAAFGIPQSKVRLNDANLASALTGDIQYQRETVKPRLVQDAEEWTETILPRFDVEPGEMWFGYDENVPQDDMAFERRASVFLASGIWNINRVRQELGEEPLPNGAGETYRINGIPIGESPAVESPLLDDGGDSREEETPLAKSIAAAIKMKADWNATLDRIIGTKEAPSGAVSSLDDELKAAFRALIPKLAEVDSPDDFARIFAELDVPKSLQAILGPALRDLFAGGWDSALSESPPIADLAKFSEYAPASAALDAHVFNLSRAISATTEQKLRNALKQGVADGLPMPERVAVVRDTMIGISDAGAERIARTETARAYATGRNELWKATGVKKKQWVLSGNPCPICLSLANIGEKPINEPFVPFGATIPGTDQTADYSAINTEPAHPNCRCYTMAVYEGATP